jgi:hypothetical protein
MGKTTERNPANQILLKLLKFNNKDKPKMQEPYGKTMKIKLESKPLGSHTGILQEQEEIPLPTPFKIAQPSLFSGLSILKFMLETTHCSSKKVNKKKSVAHKVSTNQEHNIKRY